MGEESLISELDVFTLVDEAKNGKSDRCVPIWMAPAGFGVDTGSKNLSDPASMRVCGYTRPQSTNISNGANKAEGKLEAPIWT